MEVQWLDLELSQTVHHIYSILFIFPWTCVWCACGAELCVRLAWPVTSDFQKNPFAGDMLLARRLSVIVHQVELLLPFWFESLPSSISCRAGAWCVSVVLLVLVAALDCLIFLSYKTGPGTSASPSAFLKSFLTAVEPKRGACYWSMRLLDSSRA